MPKSPTASKREVHHALVVASNTGQAMSECIDAIQRLAQAGEELTKIVDKHDSALTDHARALTDVRNDFYCRGFVGRLRWLVLGT